MSQLLIPTASLVVSGTWGLVGAASHHEAQDEGLAGTDGNATYSQGSSALGELDLTFNDMIEPGGLRTGFVFTMRARRVGAVFNPENEPRILMQIFKGSDPTVIASTLADLAVGGNVFTDYTLALTEMEAGQLWPGPVRVRLGITQCAIANTLRVTTTEFELPDPNIILEPVRMRFRFPSISIVLGGSMGMDRGAIAAAGSEAGAVAIAGSEAGWINECP